MWIETDLTRHKEHIKDRAKVVEKDDESDKVSDATLKAAHNRLTGFLSSAADDAHFRSASFVDSGGDDEVAILTHQQMNDSWMCCLLKCGGSRKSCKPMFNTRSLVYLIVSASRGKDE